jgi:hypothetical protein
MRRVLLKPFLIILAGVAVSMPLIAQAVTSAPRGMPHTAAERGSPVPPPAAFGTTEYSVTSVFAGSFNSIDTSQTILTNGNSYRFFSSSSAPQFLLGSVSIPEGVVIDYIGINNCDPGGGHYNLALYDNTTGANSTQIWQLTTNNNSCEIDYNSSHGALGYEYPMNAGHDLQIWIYSSAGTPTDGSVGVQSVEVWWRRQVSPAPATSDFGDVPTSSPQFQFIEALYHSGITAGCGGGNYCPDNPVTRGQMAVFLAKALGLNWPGSPIP